MKVVDSKTAKQNIFISWLAYSSKAPSPSVSITNIDLFSLVGSGYTHSQRPFVHGFTVGPTPNMLFLSRITLLSK